MNHDSIYNTEASGATYGDYLMLDKNVTDEELAEAKKLLIRQACYALEAVAEQREDFFIIKKHNDKTTIAWKFTIPSIEIKGGE